LDDSDDRSRARNCDQYDQQGVALVVADCGEAEQRRDWRQQCEQAIPAQVRRERDGSPGRRHPDRRDAFTITLAARKRTPDVRRQRYELNGYGHRERSKQQEGHPHRSIIHVAGAEQDRRNEEDGDRP
jgi:hypothetical protein